MISARYVLLIQKQFDIVLTDREQYELQGFLDGNEAAARFVENLGRVIEEAQELPIAMHEELLHPDPDQLFQAIITRLSSVNSNSTWFAAIVNMIKTRKPRTESRDQTELEVLRAKKSNATATPSRGQDAGASLQAARDRINMRSSSQSLNEGNTISLAQAIKQRVARNSENAHEQQDFSASREPEAPALSDSIDMIFNTSSNWPALVPGQNDAGAGDQYQSGNYQSRAGTGTGLVQTEPIQTVESHGWQAPPKANEWPTIAPPQQWTISTGTHDWDDQAAYPRPPVQFEWQTASQPVQDEWQTIVSLPAPPVPALPAAPPALPQAPLPVLPPSPQPQMINASTSIPVDEIISFVSSVFMEQEETALRAVQERMQSAPPQNPLPPNVTPLSGFPLATNVPPASAIGKTSSNLIPVDDIIAHMNNLFMEHEPSRPLMLQSSPQSSPQSPPQSMPSLPSQTPQAQTQDCDQCASGNWPQMTSLQFDSSKLARLDTAPDAGQSSDFATISGGRITSFSQFILDKKQQNAIGAIANAIVNLPTAKVLSEEESDALRECLRPIEELEGVAGCLIIGYDGMIITTTLPTTADGDSFSAWALLTYMNSQDVVRQLGHNAMKQLVSRTESGSLLLADFGQGLLLAVSENASTEAILPLMKSVRRVTAA